MQKLNRFIPAIALLLPAVAFAQGDIFDIIAAVRSLIEMLIPLVIGLALIAVLWGLAIYAFKAGDEGAQDEGKRIMFWGVIILFVMVSVWGFVEILQVLFFGEGYNPAEPPNSLDGILLPTDSGGGGGGGGDAGDSTQ